MASNAAPLRLDYHPRATRSWRWIVRSIGCLLVLSLAATMYWRKPLGDRVRLLYWQHRCLTFEAPTDRIVLETGAAATQRWMGVPGYSIHQMDSSGDKLEHALYVPPGFVSYRGTLGPNAGLNANPASIAFLHRLARPDGQQRIVAIAVEISGFLDPMTEGDEEEMLLLREVATEAISPLHYAPPKSAGVFLVGILLKHSVPLPVRHLQVFAGQPDVADPRCGHIRFDVDGVIHHVDFRLQDNDRLVFECDLWRDQHPLLREGKP